MKRYLLLALALLAGCRSGPNGVGTALAPAPPPRPAPAQNRFAIKTEP